MKKVKLTKEYDKELLNKKPSKRDRREEEGFTLVETLPDWAKDEKNIWDRRRYTREIEGWEKLCIEAYFSGWIDFFDIRVETGDHTIYFKWTEIQTNKDEKIQKDEIQTSYTSLDIYVDPQPTQSFQAATAPVDKPPPPPMS